MIFDILLNLSNENLTTCQSVRIECQTYEELFLKIQKVLELFSGIVNSISITQLSKLEREKNVKRWKNES